MATLSLRADVPLLETLEVHPPLQFGVLPGVDLYLVSLERCAAYRPQLSALLSPIERQRAAAIASAERRTAYIASRALLREALTAAAGYLVPTGAWRFGTGAHGKPFVTSPQGPDARFSLSYTRSLLALAVSPRHELGVDIEAITPEGSDEVPWQVLTSAERRFLRTLPAAEQFAEFLRLWTLKEAYTKYLGLGASLDFRRVEVSLDRREAVASSAAETRLPEPMIRQRLLRIDGHDIVLALAAGKAAAESFAAPAGESVTLLHRF